MKNLSVLVVFIIAALVGRSTQYFITVDANSEECFFDKVLAGTRLGLMFEVIEGGFLDIDVKVNEFLSQHVDLNSLFICFWFKITGPDGKIIHQVDRESNGKYTFSAHSDGIYKYCFSNKMSTMTPKIVMFSMDVGEQHAQQSTPSAHEANNSTDHHDKLEKMIGELTNALTGVKHEQEYMEVRERIHRASKKSFKFFLIKNCKT